MITTVFYHSADYDGVFCREIARKFLPMDTVLVGWDFGDKQLPFPSEGDVYVLDLPVERIFSNEPDPTRAIWIDHHKSSIDAAKLPYCGYRIDGVAACRLTWQWFNDRDLPNKESFLTRNVLEPLAVRLAGEYDVWDHRDEQQDVVFQYGLDAQKEIDWEQLLGVYGEQTLVDKMLRDGRAAQQCVNKRNAEIVKAKGFDLRFEGRTFLALNTPTKGSLQFETALQPQHDACLAFSWNGHEWVVSMYGIERKRDLDLSEIAIKFGGGGHRQACGFQARHLPWLPS